jgi:hypothetical protein
MREHSEAPGWYSWEGVVDAAEHLSAVARSGCECDVSVSVEGGLQVEGYAVIRLDGGWHIGISSALSPGDAEATVLHELGHLLLGHVGAESYTDNLREDAARMTDIHRGPQEIEADAIGAALVPLMTTTLFHGAAAIEE